MPRALPYVRAMLCSLLVAAGLAGCGKQTATVSGKLTVGGTPLPFGTVNILAAEGVPQEGKINPDGSYTVLNVPRGPVKILVTAIDPEEVEMTRRLTGAGNKTGTTVKTFDSTQFWLIHPDYGDLTKGKLSVDVDKNPFTFDADLQENPNFFKKGGKK